MDKEEAAEPYPTTRLKNPNDLYNNTQQLYIKAKLKG